MAWDPAPLCWQQISFTSIPWECMYKKIDYHGAIGVSVLTVIVAPFSFSKNYDQWKPPLHNTYIHTYIIGQCNSSVRITVWLLTPLMLCALILYVSDGTYSLTSTTNDRFLTNFFMAGLFTFRIFAWPGIRTRGFTSNKPRHYQLKLLLLQATPNIHS